MLLSTFRFQLIQLILFACKDNATPSLPFLACLPGTGSWWKVCLKASTLLPVFPEQLEQLIIFGFQGEVFTLMHLDTIVKSTDPEFHILYSY